MVSAAIDFEASTVTIRTRAKGMLARLAHDLEIDASDFAGEVELDGDAWTASLVFDAAKLRVVGVPKGQRVDRTVLSSSDKDEIEQRMRTELRGGRVEVRAEGSDRRRGEVKVKAAAGEQTLPVSISVEERSDGELVAKGELKLSLKRLGIQEIKGPLGAFKVDDAVEVAFRIALRLEG
jgi:hypothetical protein